MESCRRGLTSLIQSASVREVPVRRTPFAALNSDPAQRTSSLKAGRRRYCCISTWCGFLLIGSATLVRYSGLEFLRFDGQEELPRPARMAWAFMEHNFFGSVKHTVAAAPLRPAHTMHGGTRASEATREWGVTALFRSPPPYKSDVRNMCIRVHAASPSHITIIVGASRWRSAQLKNKAQRISCSESWTRGMSRQASSRRLISARA